MYFNNIKVDEGQNGHLDFKKKTIKMCQRS